MTETKTEGNTIPSLQILYIHSDQDLISHVQSNEEVMKIKEMLTKGNYFAFWEIYPNFFIIVCEGQ